MFAHAFFSAFAIVEQTRISDFAFEFVEASALALDEGIKVHLEPRKPFGKEKRQS